MPNKSSSSSLRLVYLITYFYLFIQLILQSQCINLRHHQYWFVKWRQQISNPTKNAFQTKQWNYCDMKCLYLQNYHDYDFVVIQFHQQAYRPDFAACYAKITNGSSSSTKMTMAEQYVIWDHVITNKFYEQACGMDMEDYLQSSKQYQVTKISGQGRQFQTHSSIK